MANSVLDYLSALMQDARCFRCIPGKTVWEIQTYLLAYIRGAGVDPSALAKEAKCLQCLSIQSLLEIRAFLLATINGTGNDPSSMVQNAQCFEAIPRGDQMEVQAYLLAQDPKGPGITDPNLLAQAANGFQGVPPTICLQIQVFALATMAGVSTDPNALMALFRCGQCLPSPLLSSVASQSLEYSEPVPSGSGRSRLVPPPVKQPGVGRGGGVNGGGGGGGTLNPVATDWGNRVQANGGAPPSVNTGKVVSNFVDTLQAGGIWSKMKTINLMIGPDLATMATPLLKGAGSDPWGNVNFVAADVSAMGMMGDASSKYFNTGVAPKDVFNTANGGMSVLVPYNTTTSDYIIRAVTGALNNDCYIASLQSGNSLFAIPRSTAAPISQAYPGNGFFSCSRTANNVFNAYWGNTSVALAQLGATSAVDVSSEAANMAAATSPLFLFASNNSGSPVAYSDKQVSFVAIHDGLTLAETTILYNAAYTLRLALMGGAEFPPIYDTLESYSNGDALNGKAGGARWSTAYVGKTA